MVCNLFDNCICRRFCCCQKIDTPKSCLIGKSSLDRNQSLPLYPAAKTSTRAIHRRKPIVTLVGKNEMSCSGMVAEGILLKEKEWLITRCEKSILIIWRNGLDIIVISIASLSGALDQLFQNNPSLTKRRRKAFLLQFIMEWQWIMFWFQEEQ